MYILHPTHQLFLSALLDAEVAFLLMGRYAVVYHGCVRSTGDMDIWLKPTNANKIKTLRALRQAQIHPDDIKLLEEKFDFTGVVVFHFGNPPERIDFLTVVQGIEFSDAYKRRQLMRVQGREVPVLHLNDLIISKLIAARPQDKADVEMLQQIKRKLPPD